MRLHFLKNSLPDLLSKGKPAVFLLLFLLHFSLVRANGQANISISANNMPVEQVLKSIQAQSGYTFLYTKELVSNTGSITLDLKDVELSEALQKIEALSSIEFAIVDKTVVVKASKSKLPASKPTATENIKAIQKLTVTGIVYDAEGKLMAGASVVIKGTGIGTTTNEKGEFTIDVEAGATLVFSAVGHVPEERKVTSGSATALKIVLQQEQVKLENIIVTALGISKSERKLGYATTKVDGSLLNQVKEANIANSLGGRVSGLNVSGVNSGPGSSARILVRGISNFTSSSGPLIVIDGVPMDNTQKGSAGVYGGADGGDGISSLNADDIENIVVLKGSTASALYGARAANGVIQVTTKSGKGAKGFAVEFGSNFNVNEIIDYTDYQKVFGHGINGQKPENIGDLAIAGLNSWGELMNNQPAIALDGKLHPYSPVKRQQRDFYSTAPVYINTLSFLNSGQNGNMRLSLSQTKNNSVVPNSYLDRYSINLNINQKITNKLSLSLMNNLVSEKVNNRPALNDMSRNPNFTMAALPANISPDYLKPGYNAANGYEYAMNSDGYQTNPWFAVAKFENNSKRNRLISSTQLRYDFTKEIYLQGRLGVDYYVDDLWNLEPTGTGYKRTGALSEQSKASTMELNADVLAGFSHHIVPKLVIDAAVGANKRIFKYEKSGTSGLTWKTPFLYTVSNLDVTRPIYGILHKETNSGYYTFDVTYNKYLTVSTTGRYDIFSTLPENSRGIFTPSVSSSFVFSDLFRLSALKFGRLRISYAQTSGEAAPYQTKTYYELQAGSNQGMPLGNTLSQTSNTASLKPYRLKEFEIGLDTRWLDSRLNVDVSYFSRRTANELIAKAITIATGYTSSYEPLGVTSNKGIELAVNAVPLKSSKLTWNTSFNFTSVNNQLVSIGDESGSTTVIRKDGEGQYRPSVGPFNNGAFIGNLQGYAVSQVMAYDYRYDSKGQIVIGANGIPARGNLIPMGSGLPKYFGGFNNELISGHFSFSFLVDYRFGVTVLSGTDFFSIYYGLNKSTLPGRETGIIAKGVTTEGSTNTLVVPAQVYYQGLASNISTISVFDGSFIKLRQVVLGYSFPDRYFKRLQVQNVKLSLVARNLAILFRHTDNFDPEDNFSSLPGNAGLQGGGMPPVRTYGVNLNFQFKN